MPPDERLPVECGWPQRVDMSMVSESASTSSGCNNSAIAVRPRVELSDLAYRAHQTPFRMCVPFMVSPQSPQSPLAPAARLTICICALSASVSFHPSIIGPSTIRPPTSFAGANLRGYGVNE
ncbi:hypothetical protein MSAN_01855500 [Mycena sanguinolenta]|uniref:Uncharacterized protein n=1 Tax=Mycena sanguinolenta TaxID=230812 RepID=A0A8H6XRQ5_9AGAR|nr:hypothetical protein MSAN_01855500 [Mycena sanguinolenta]